MVRLSVNVNKIALLRNSRGGDIPNVREAARTCIKAGCHGITVHPRPDARHITYRDVSELCAMTQDEYGLEFNVEGYPTAGFLDLVCRVMPAQVTLVPDAPGVLTSDRGWDLGRRNAWLRGVMKRLTDGGMRVSLFVEPDGDTIRRAGAIGANRVELYTGPYAKAFGTPQGGAILRQHREAARIARSVGLGLNAGHDLNLDNLPTYVKAMRGLDEVSIGHALITDAIYYGITRTVRMYLKALGSKPSAAARRTAGAAGKRTARARRRA